MVIIDEAVWETEPVMEAGGRLVGRTWGALGRSAALESETTGLPRRATSSFDRGIGTRDVKLRDHLERKHGHQATVDPANFFPSASPAAESTAPKQHDSLAIWDLLGADNSSSSSGSSSGGFTDPGVWASWASPPGAPEHGGTSDGAGPDTKDVEWDDTFRGIITAAAIAPTPPSSPWSSSAAADSSGAIGGRVYVADDERAPPPPLFSEVGKPSMEASWLGSGGGGGGGGGGGEASFGESSGGLGGGVPSQHGCDDHQTANQRSLVEVRPNDGRAGAEAAAAAAEDLEFHELFGAAGGKGPIADHFSQRARARGPRVAQAEDAAAGPFVAVEEASPGRESSSSAAGAAAAAAAVAAAAFRPEPEDTTAGATPVFSRPFMSVEEADVMPVASGDEGGGRNPMLSPPASQDLEHSRRQDSIGWMLTEGCDSTMPGAETLVKEGEAADTAPFGDFVEDAAPRGQSAYSGRAAAAAQGVEDGGAVLPGVNDLLTSAVARSEVGDVRAEVLGVGSGGGGGGGGGGGWNARLPTYASQAHGGIDLQDSVGWLFSEDIVEDGASLGVEPSNSGRAAAASPGVEDGGARLLGADALLTSAVAVAEVRGVGGGGGSGTAGWNARLPTYASQAHGGVDLKDSVGWLFSEDIMDGAAFRAEPENAGTAAAVAAAATAGSGEGDSETVPNVGAGGTPVSGVRENEVGPEGPPASASSVPTSERMPVSATAGGRDGGRGRGRGGGGVSRGFENGGVGTAAASASETTAPPTSTLSWLGSAAGLVRKATTVIAVALSTGDGRRSKEKGRGRRPNPGGNPRLGTYPGGFPCRREIIGEVRARQKRQPAVHYAYYSDGRWADRDAATPWTAQPVGHVRMKKSRSPCV